MSRKIIAAGAALATASATLLAAPAADAAGRGVTHVKVTKKHSVTAPATLRPGVVHLRNDGRLPILIVRKKHEGIDSLVRYANAEKVSVAKRLYTRFGLVELLAPRADDYVRISRGTYYLLGAASKLKAANVRTVVVRGKTSNANRPAVRNVTISRAGSLSGASTGPVRPALRLRNHAASPQGIIALRLAADTTDAQLRDLIAKPSATKLFDLVGEDFDFTEVGLIGPRQDVTTRTTLRAGRYVLWAISVFGASSKIRRGQLAALTLR